jgi:hypothetical protein
MAHPDGVIRRPFKPFIYLRRPPLMTSLPERRLTHLKQLEAESIQIIREVAAEFDNPVMLYSVGKDSAVMLHLARKAFFPGTPPFPLLHVDTTWKFREMIEFRDRLAAQSGMELLVHIYQEGVDMGVGPFSHGSATHTDVMKTQSLKQAMCITGKSDKMSRDHQRISNNRWIGVRMGKIISMLQIEDYIKHCLNHHDNFNMYDVRWFIYTNT